MNRKKMLRSIALSTAAVAWAGDAWAANKTWAAAASGLWTTAAAWSAAGAPANGDTVLITANSAANYIVNYDNPSAIQTYPVMTLNSTGGGAAQLRTSAGGDTYNVTNATVATNGEGNWQIGSATANLGTLILGASAGGSGTATLNTGTLDIVNRLQIGAFGSGAFTQTAGSVSADIVTLASNGTGTGTYQMNGGTLTVTNGLGPGASGAGTFNQAGGVVNAGNVTLAGTSAADGRYNLSGGTLSAGFISIGGAGPGTLTLSAGQINVTTGRVGHVATGQGTVTQTGGTFSVSGALILAATAGATGVYNLQAGILDAGSIVINDGGTFTHTGGVPLASAVTLNTGGTWSSTAGLNTNIDTFTQDGGTVLNEYFNNEGNFVYNAGSFPGHLENQGTLTLNADMVIGDGLDNRGGGNTIAAARTLTLNGSGLTHRTGTLFLFGNLNSTTSGVGGANAASNALFAHQGGVHTVSNELQVGISNGAGTYNLNGGTLNVGAGAVGASIGVNQPGQLNLVNGRANIANLRIGHGAPGTVNHNGGGDLVGTTLTVGSLSAGTYTQNNAGASVALSNGLIIGTQGRYNLTNGTLTSAQTSNNGSFTQSGGRATLNQVSGAAGRMDILGTASLTVDRIRQDFLFVADTARIFTTPNGGPNGVSRLNSLFFDDFENISFFGRWDLTDNDLVLDYSTNSPLEDTFRYIRSGYNFGSWTGTGLNSSFAASAVGPDTALGYAEASAVLASFPATFVGQTVDSTTLLVRYTLAGDADLNGTVNLDDFTRLAAGFGGTNNLWSRGDFNYDRAVNLDDFTALAANFGLNLASDLPRGSNVPEPASILSVFALCGLMNRPRTRRRW